MGFLWRCTPVLLAACGASFIEATPPELETVSRSWLIEGVDEPVVFGLILDLHITDRALCEATARGLEEDLRRIFGAGALQLDTIDLSPDCRQGSQRRLPAEHLLARIADVKRQQAPAIVRPVIVYVNNVDLPLPAQVSDTLEQATKWMLEPVILWTVALPEAMKRLPSERHRAWTYAGDPALIETLEKWAASDLPLVSLDASRPGDGQALLADDELARVEAFKICSAPKALISVGFDTDGAATFVEREQPPRFFFFENGVRGAMPGTFTPPTVSMTLELCTAHCDRWIETPGKPAYQWSESPWCEREAR